MKSLITVLIIILGTVSAANLRFNFDPVLRLTEVKHKNLKKENKLITFQNFNA